MRPLLDSSVLIAADATAADIEVAVASVSSAELACGVRIIAYSVQQAAVRQARLERLTARLGLGLPFGDEAATCYWLLAGVVHAPASPGRFPGQ